MHDTQTALCTDDIPDEVLNDEDLQSLRDQVEQGLSVVTMFIPYRCDAPDVLCVVLQGTSGAIHCHRYMRRLNGDWDVSYDAQGVSTHKAFRWIASPRAL